MYKDQKLARYFAQWVDTYKRGAVREVTLAKYLKTQEQLEALAPDVTLGSFDRAGYQRILNKYAETHERATVMDFHHQVRAALLDAVEDGIIRRDPTRRAVIKGKEPATRKSKYLSRAELAALLAVLEPDEAHPWDRAILLVARTGLRFAEALGVTPADFDLDQGTLTISKTWNYKSTDGGFAPTKNRSSVRVIAIDAQLCGAAREWCEGHAPAKPLFVPEDGRVFNVDANDRLADRCHAVGVPVISMHGLRHTHASILLYAGVSIASVAKRLGHANMATTQSTYLHIIRELEAADSDKLAWALGGL